MKIFHIAHLKDWEEAQKQEKYTADSLATQGFIHCSKDYQVVDVADAIFKGQKDLILLEIDTEKVKPGIKFEKPLGEKEEYPHIYGALNTDAVIKVSNFKPDVNGFFTFPRDLP